MTQYLVTGGAGFIGSHLCEHLLDAGHKVRVLDNLTTGAKSNLPREVDLIVGDITRPGDVQAAMDGVAGCFHLAAVASVQAGNERWADCHASNLTGTVHVFDAARQAAVASGPIPVVYASSAAVYGANQDVPLSEDAIKVPLTAYGADKLGCELHAQPAWGVHGVPTTGMRFFNVYGPRQDPRSPYSGVISIFADRFSRGLPVTIHGDGSQSRDFIYVGDVCRALMAAMETTKTGARVFNVCTSREISIADLAKTLAAITGNHSAITHGPERAGDIRRSLGNNGAMVSSLGVTPQTMLRDGLEKTLATLLPVAA